MSFLNSRHFRVRLVALSVLALVGIGLIPTAARAQEQAPLSSSQGVVQAVPRSQCFPFETLPADLRPKAEALLLRLMDSEALYTLIGGLKPMSSGYSTYSLELKTPDLQNLDEARRILTTFRCGDAYVADVLPFHSVSNGKRYHEAVVFYRPAVEQMVQMYQPFWAPYGITPTTDPMSIVLITEHDPTTARNRGLGYLYGYPKHAVDFFVASADAQGETDKLVARDFVQIPTFVSDTGRFVYAVPKGYTLAPRDTNLKAKAERVLAAYKERRAKYIGPGKPGAMALLRDWLDDGKGNCSPRHAQF